MNILKTLCEKTNFSWRFLKFLMVGALNTVFGYSVFALFTYLNLHYTISTLLATILGILFNFKTTGCIVFKNGDNKLIFKFLFVYGVTYLLSIAFLRICEYFGFTNMYLNYAILLLPNAMIAYSLMKKFVFTNK